ncbi:hypothetical protein HMPREF0658_0989 [Hoylesella marshii DSM 16973 = JCM 13450]|uniref:Uncharacterized protein n=1 Tax=Hoylesella marshii DSM 16973 = JCM 13450 TaxID=862515 RepID=E0NS38_9BACT|nr:hypothetical protein HMPREF0658_0989 [Hoylesella marshii DSM 16973 = JCM 13450]
MLAPQGFTFDIMPAGIEISIKKRVVRVITTRTTLLYVIKQFIREFGIRLFGL